MSNKYSSLQHLSDLVRQVTNHKSQTSSNSLQSTNSSSHHLTATTMSPSSLSTEECSSSRYSSLQDTESLKSAILDSFRMHWIQAWSIMEHKILDDITMDDLSSIVNHIEQMISLMVEEANAISEHTSASFESGGGGNDGSATALSPLLNFLLDESILDKVFQWSEMAGEWKYAMYLEQLKLYELLISQLCQADTILFQKPFMRPMIRLLNALSNSSSTGGFYNEIEKRLVLLLNTLCVAISQNPRLLEVLLVYNRRESRVTSNGYLPPSLIEIDDSNQTSSPESCTDLCDTAASALVQSRQFTFPVFLLLIQFVHREGAIGQQSRDALLLCLGLSRADDRLAYYIVGQTDFCPLLATGLSGLFSSLPRVVIGQSMSAEQFQFKDDLLHNSKDIEQFIKCLDFCNAVVQITHPIVQAQLLNYIYNGFLVSVIGPALHQDVANVSIEDLESIPTYSNTLDEIITTTAYLDMFIQSISEPKLIRIFLEFLCLEQFDNRCIINTLISRLGAKSKLSLITLILFKTLLDLNCEDLQFELIFKFLLRGKHLQSESAKALPKVNGHVSPERGERVRGIEQAVSLYQQNWLAISGQKLFSNSLSHYLHSLCPHQTLNGHLEMDDPFDSSFALTGCKCNAAYYHNYLDYLSEARFKIGQHLTAIGQWKNVYSEMPAPEQMDFEDEDVSFCSTQIDESQFNNNLDSLERSKLANSAQSNGNCNLLEDDETAKFGGPNSLSSIQSEQYYLSQRQRKRSEGGQNRMDSLEETGLDVVALVDEHNPPTIGLFLHTLMVEVEKFFENDVLTNLHLSALLVSLCHSPHRLTLSLFFDETLARARGVPCLLHILQKLSLDAQNYCDEIPNFESMFKTAKINLDSVPIGELNCQLITGNHHLKQQQNQQPQQSTQNSQQHSQVVAKTNNLEANLNKGFGALKSLFFRSLDKGRNQAGSLTRRDSNASMTSTTSHVLEVVPGGVRFINQASKPKEQTTANNQSDGNLDKVNELIYNCILFDEFLMELSAILLEQSILVSLRLPTVD